MDGLIEGRIVHYVLPPPGRNAGQHRGAMIVKVWDNLGYVNLLVFQDGMNDGVEYGSGPTWVTSVHYSETKEPRTWHWIEKA